MLASIFSQHMITHPREKGEGREKARALSQQSRTLISPQRVKGCKVS